MSSKIATCGALIAIMIFGVMYAVSINRTSSGAMGSASIGPAYYPNLLTVILIALCAIGLLRTWKKPGGRISFPGFKYILLTTAMTALFIAVWHVTEVFYPTAFFYLVILFTVFRVGKSFRRSLLTGGAVALGITAIIYALFELVLAMKL